MEDTLDHVSTSSSDEALPNLSTLLIKTKKELLKYIMKIKIAALGP